jgi:hypothetical protein
LNGLKAVHPKGCTPIPHPALSMLKLSPAMAAALPRSISFVTTALTIAVLIELNGDDLRRDPLQVRKATLASILAKAGPGIRFNEHIKGDGRLRPCLQDRARVTRSLRAKPLPPATVHGGPSPQMPAFLLWADARAST